MKITCYMIALLLLAGCQSHVSQYDAQYQAQQNALAAAQAEVDAELLKCTKGKPLKEVPRKEYLKGTKCFTKLVEEKVLPVTPYPALWQKFLYINLENAALYSQGKIEYEQVAARAKLAALEMQEEENRRYNQTRQGYAQQDAIEEQHLSEALQGFAPKRPVYTNCSTFGRSTQCVSQ